MKNVKTEVVETLKTLNAVSTDNTILDTWKLRMALAEHPRVTRVQFRRSSEAAGFNGLTARNIFDKVKQGK